MTNIEIAKQAMKIARECLIDIFQTGSNFPHAKMKPRIHIAKRGIDEINQAMKLINQSHSYEKSQMEGVDIDAVHKRVIYQQQSHGQ